MVSGGTVSSDLSSIQSAFDNYSSTITGLSSVWSGPSYDNFISCTEDFSSSYLSTIRGEMEAFATACDLYVKYTTAKGNYATTKGNYEEAVEKNDTPSISKFKSEMASYEKEMEELEVQITSLLKQASSTKLESSGFSDSTSSTISTNYTNASSHLEDGKNYWQPQNNGENCGITSLMVATNILLNKNEYTDNVGEWKKLGGSTETIGWSSGKDMAKRWISSHDLDDKIEVTGVQNIHNTKDLQDHLRKGEVVVASSSGKVFKRVDGSTVNLNHYITFYAIDDEGNCYANDSAGGDSSNNSGIKYTPEDLARFYGEDGSHHNNGSITLRAI